MTSAIPEVNAVREDDATGELASSAQFVVHPALHAVLGGFVEARIRWCLLRREDAMCAPGRHVGILIDVADAKRVEVLLSELGFLRDPAIGRASHMFFFKYDIPTDSWTELDIVTEFAYGPHDAFKTRAEADCLARRRRAGTLETLAPDDAFWTLLLHCLLDEQTIGDDHARCLDALSANARADGQLGKLVERVCPAEWSANRLVMAVRSHDWMALEQLAPALAASWRQKESRGVSVRARIEKHTREFHVRRLFRRRGISIALLGPDGAGKSTLASGIGRSNHFPVKHVYMGLWPQHIDRRARLDSVRGVAWLIRLLRAWRRYAVARLYLAFGYMVIFDRYTFDALLPVGTTRRLRSIAYWILGHSCPAPDLIFVLDAPGRVMFDRKGEHHPEYLEAQRQYFRLLSTKLQNAYTIDTTRGADVVRREVMAHIWHHVSGRAIPRSSHHAQASL
jgi:thymidylate kinase